MEKQAAVCSGTHGGVLTTSENFYGISILCSICFPVLSHVFDLAWTKLKKASKTTNIFQVGAKQTCSLTYKLKWQQLLGFYRATQLALLHGEPEI